MAGRREKLRRVGIIPEYRGFTPDGLASGDAIDMTVDELEVGSVEKVGIEPHPKRVGPAS